MVLWLTMHKPHGAQDVDDGYFIFAPSQNPLSDGTLVSAPGTFPRD
jgi:hypothetical protein